MVHVRHVHLFQNAGCFNEGDVVVVPNMKGWHQRGRELGGCFLQRNKLCISGSYEKMEGN